MLYGSSMDAGGSAKIIWNSVCLSRLSVEDHLSMPSTPFICHAVSNINSRGLWFRDDPLDFSLPLLLLQLSLISILSRTIYICLKPLAQPFIISQIIGGVILGPTVLGSNSAFIDKVYPPSGRDLFETLSVFGFMFFIFLAGVKIDPSMLLKSRKRALAIGILGYFVPYALAGFAASAFYQFVSLDPHVSEVLPLVVALQSITTFPVVSCFLDELKILNSEVGHLATSSSIVSDACHWSFVAVKFVAALATGKSTRSSILTSFISIILLLTFIVFGIRPTALWASRRIPEGKPVKEIYILAVLVTLLVCGFLGEVVGLSAFTASFLMGLVIPDGPPLGAALVERLDCFVSVTLLPIFFTMCGLMTNLFAIKQLKNVGVIQAVMFVAFSGKMLATVLPSLCCRMPFRDALSLGLIMNSKGIIELTLLVMWKRENVINGECYAIMLISAVVVTGMISPLVKILYDPSKKFVAYKRRTILHHRCNEELRVLACIHMQDNVQAILDLLTASNPTKESPIPLIVLHLAKLTGRASSLLVTHKPRDKPSQHRPTQSEQIFDVFTKFEEHYHGDVILHCFKGISPYATMHNDVCSLALEKRTTLIIIPFHKQWKIGRWVESSNAFRQLNKNVLEKAPCSVGVLIGRTIERKFLSLLVQPSSFRVAVLFFGGADDREALAYAGRISKHPNVLITLFHFSSSTEIVSGTARSKMLDTRTLSEFRLNAFRNKRVFYQEEEVTTGRGVHDLLATLGNEFELIMVGRRHGESWLMSDLKNYWNEHEELGPIGDILSAPDTSSSASVLVVQQQTKLWGLHDAGEESTHLRKL